MLEYSLVEEEYSKARDKMKGRIESVAQQSDRDMMLPGESPIPGIREQPLG